ncbi:MAG TPA: protein kinase [Gemmataceae bacterium]|nr:protein kinase [Gemmataceae bacterium]
MPRSTCLTSAELTAFQSGDLPEPLLVEIAEHLESCSRCEAAAQALDGLTDPRMVPFRRTARTRAGGREEPLPQHVGGYEILERVGRGGMGVVYRARHVTLRRVVALKMLLSGAFADREERLRFRAEAEAVACLQHPNIVQLFDLGEHDAGTGAPRPYFTLEFVDGDSLATRLGGRPQAPAQATAWLEPLARGVHHAHEHGLVHRDLKPSNVLLTREGQPKICDFGVAKRLQGSDLKTMSGMLVGTAEYMAPEQADGKAVIGPAADIYALGALLYAMLTGRPPFQGAGTFDTLEQVRTREPVAPRSLQPSVPRDLETICLKCLQKEPARRYATALALAEDLRRFRFGEPIVARPVGKTERALKWVRRNPRFALLVALLVVSVLGGLLGVTWKWLDAETQRSRADAQARQVDIEKLEALRQAYRGRLAAAAAALQNHDVADAARQLWEAPESLRGWEWQHLHSRLDDRSGVIRAAPGETLILLPNPQGIQVGRVENTHLNLTDLDGEPSRSLSLRATVSSAQGAQQTSAGLRFVESVGKDTLRLWDEMGNLLLSLTVPTVPPVTLPAAKVRLSPDGSRLAVSLCQEGRYGFALYETSSGNLTATCLGHTGQLYVVAFSADGTRIASAGEDGVACIWNVGTGAKIAECRAHTRKILAAAFDSNATRLLTASADGTVRQWDASTGRQVEPAFDHHSGEVLAVAYSPDGLWVASGGTDRTVRLWRALGRQEVAILHGHTGAVTEVAFTPDGRRLASVSQNRGLDWAGDNTLGVWEVDLAAGLPVLRGHTSYVYPVAFSPNGYWIASGSWDHTVRVWDAVTGELCATLLHPGVVRVLAFSPDGNSLVTRNDGDNRLRIWDAATASIRKEIEGPRGYISFLALSPDGSRIALTTYVEERGYRFTICDVSSGEAKFSAPGAAFAYSHDGRWLVGRLADQKTVVLMDAQTYQACSSFRGHEATVCSATFSQDDRYLATCSEDRTARLWEIDSGTCTVLRGHTDDVFAAAFHPDGTRLATAGRDRAIWLWDLTEGEEVARLPGHTSYVWSLAFSPDGKTLVSGSGDGTVRLWDTEPLAKRYQARREARVHRPEAERIVERLFQEKKEPAEVVAALRADHGLSEPFRRAALREVMRRKSK